MLWDEAVPCSCRPCLWKAVLRQMLKTCVLWVTFQFMSQWHEKKKNESNPNHGYSWFPKGSEAVPLFFES